MRFRWFVWPFVVAAPLLVSCGSDEPNAGEVLGTVDGHSVMLQDNSEGPNAPCVGVEVRTSVATMVTVACPTLPAEEDAYAATITVDSKVFVVGFGLSESETVVDDGFGDIFVSDEVDGRRFFAAQVTDGEVVEAVTISDGESSRELQTA